MKNPKWTQNPILNWHETLGAEAKFDKLIEGTVQFLKIMIFF